jgi:sorbitol-specific phosphotransferase system component IIC
MGERKEIFMRIFVGIVTGIILSVWKVLIIVFFVINWIYILFVGKRLKELAKMSEVWNTQMYIFVRYLIFLTNKRPFPFNKLEKSISKYEK